MKNRRSIRLKGYDYSQDGAYFVTLCTYNRECLFGKIHNKKMILSALGKIVADEWEKTPQIRKEIKLDEWVLMPNHFHAVVFIINDSHRTGDYCTGDQPVARTWHPSIPRTSHPLIPRTSLPSIAPTGPKSKSIAALMAGFKSSVTKHINKKRNRPGCPVWQRNYYEHIVRNEESLNRIRKYIQNNPLKWDLDKNNRKKD